MKSQNYFIVGKNNIYYINDSFKYNFYGMEIKEIAKILDFRILEKIMTDKEILEQLRPEECTLADLIQIILELTLRLVMMINF